MHVNQSTIQQGPPLVEMVRRPLRFTCCTLLGDQSQGSWHHDPCPGNTASIREHSLTQSLPKQKDLSPGKGQGDVQVQVPAFGASVRQPGTQSGILDPSSSPGLFTDAAQGFEKVAGEGDLRARASEEAPWGASTQWDRSEAELYSQGVPRQRQGGWSGKQILHSTSAPSWKLMLPSISKS